MKMLNNPITSNDIEAGIKKNLPNKKSPGPDELIAEFYKTFREVMTLILLRNPFSEIAQTLNHKTNFNKFKRIEIFIKYVL